MTEGIFSTALLGPLPEPAPGLTDHEIRALQALLRLKKDPLEEVAGEVLGLEVTNIYDHGAPVWHNLAQKGFVLWAGDHWRLLDEDATRRALAVEMLQERPTEFRRLEQPFLVSPGVPIGLQITEDGGKKVSRG